MKVLKGALFALTLGMFSSVASAENNRHNSRTAQPGSITNYPNPVYPRPDYPGRPGRPGFPRHQGYECTARSSGWGGRGGDFFRGFGEDMQRARFTAMQTCRYNSRAPRTCYIVSCELVGGRFPGRGPFPGPDFPDHGPFPGGPFPGGPFPGGPFPGRP